MAAGNHRPRLITQRAWWLPALVLVMHLLYFCAALVHQSFLIDDSIQYLTLSENLAQHGVYSQSFAAPFVPDLQRPPGYPVLLLLCGGIPWLVLLLQHLMVLATGYFLFRLLVPLAGLKWARRGAFFWLLQPYPILMASLLLSESPFLCLLALGLWMYTAWRRKGCWKRLSAAVLALVAATYFRPIGMVVLFPMLVDMAVLTLRRGQWRYLSIGLGIPLLLIAPWMLRNGIATGEYTFNSMGAMGMVHGRMGGMEAVAQDLPMDEHHWFMLGDSLAAQEVGLAGIKSYYGANQSHETEIYHVGMGETVKRFLAKPGEALVFQAKAFWGMLRGVGYGWAERNFQSSGAAIFSAGWQGLCNLVMFLGTGLALFRFRGMPPGRTWLFVAMLLLYLASMAIWADGRYRVPIDLFHTLFAVTACAIGWKKKSESLE